jgi:hypothetical protein
MPFEVAIRGWFEKEWGGSLVLPDGWFGRPYDNQHALTSYEDSGEEIALCLDDHLLLTFYGLSNVAQEGRDLVIGPFERLSFEARPYGGGNAAQRKEYQGGTVKLIAAPGS